MRTGQKIIFVRGQEPPLKSRDTALIASALGVAALCARGSGSARCAAVRRCVIAAYATRD